MNNRGTLEEPRTCSRALVTSTRSRAGLLIIASPLGGERNEKKKRKRGETVGDYHCTERRGEEGEGVATAFECQNQ